MFLGPDGPGDPGGFHLGPDEAVNSVQWLLFSRPGICCRGILFLATELGCGSGMARLEPRPPKGWGGSGGGQAVAQAG